MERREFLTLGIIGLAASIGAVLVWTPWKKKKITPESPRGLSIERASLRAAATTSFNEDDTLVEEAPTILNALHMYSQDSAKLDAYIHRSITCNHCSTSPIRGLRYKCANCPDFDLCAMCEALEIHDRNHVFLKIKIPIPPLSNCRTSAIPLFYPGSSIQSGIATSVR